MKVSNKFKMIAGIDEVGRGPLAGPVFAAAVILDPDRPIEGLKDAKKLSPKRREQLASLIKYQALCYALGRAEVAEIDAINILNASLLAMQRAVRQLTRQPDLALVDGLYCPHMNCCSKSIIKGDEIIPQISAASIIAKVARDQEMINWDPYYPKYGFANHKGYPTSQHTSAIKKYGITPLHRRSFAPVKALDPLLAIE